MRSPGGSEAKSTREIVMAKVLPLLKAKVPEDQWKKLRLKMTPEVEAGIQSQSKENILIPLLCGWMMGTFAADGVNIEYQDLIQVAAEAAAAVMTALRQASGAQPTVAQENLELLKAAFTATYIGGAHVEFEQYLRRCWGMYAPGVYKAPYVAVVQSSGFGKSRMLYQLGVMAQPPDSKMKVMYMCTRLQASTGFPVATDNLRRWLFPDKATSESIAERLEAIYHHAMEDWAGVQDEWLKLFTDSDQDSVVEKQLSATLTNLQAKPRPLKTSPSSKKTVSSDTDTSSILKDKNAKMVVLVIDEARALLGSDSTDTSHFRHLRHALVKANDAIGLGGGIFGVLVDTNSKVSDLTPLRSTDPSSRGVKEYPASFPPFVLTHTMDVKWKEFWRSEMEKKHGNATAAGAGSAAGGDRKEVALDSVDRGEGELDAYKCIVLKGGPEAWDALKRMGRPLWASTSTHGKLASSGLVRLAANKLMLGLPPGNDSYTEATMFGVASMLCRLGVRPYSTSALASRAVADFMAVLAHVNYEREGFLSSYASDPVLALGAMRVWYAKSNALAEHILPQLKKLVLDEALDTGGVGEMVARILMLLAMDKCVMGDRSILECEFTGQFIPVASFLAVLGVGHGIPVRVKGMATADTAVQKAFTEWQSRWDDWEMGFNHFIQLQLEPNEDTLWQLLGRRAAGIFPRNQYGADLVIPIFRRKPSVAKVDDEEAARRQVEPSSEAAEADPEGEGEVSVVLIQVKNRHPEDSTFFKSATKKLCPWFVFGEPSKKSGGAFGEERGASGDPSLDHAHEENPLRKKPVQEVIRIYMNLRGQKDCKFVYATSLADNSPSGTASSEPSGSSKEMADNSPSGTASSEPSGSSKEMNSRKGKQKRVANSAVKEGDETALSVKKTMKKLVPSEAVFTLCFHTISSETYPFVSEQVASKLRSLVVSLWKPMEMVKGDLQHRREVEERNAKLEVKPLLSKAMPDKDVERIAYNGLVHLRGHLKRAKQLGIAAKETSKAASKRPRSGEQGGGPVKRRATGRELE